MRRWDYGPTHCDDARCGELRVSRSGDWVDHDDHLVEVRQTQRRMIAALYWRAGESDHWLHKALLMSTAEAMEAAL